MPTSSTQRTTGRRMVTVFLATTFALSVAAVPSAEAAPPDGAAPPDVIVLPGASSAEGIARGEDATFYAGDLLRGDIFRGDLEARTAELFIDAPDGRLALGMSVDRRHDLLFVAGGFTGQAYVYDLASGETVATYQFAPPSPPDAESPTTLVNDVTVTWEGAWFTDSRRAQLYFVPVSLGGQPGEFRTLALQGPAADTSGDINLNGIAAADCGRSTLIVAHTTNGELYTVNPATGDSAEISGLSLPSVDGIVVKGQHLWAVQNTNQVTDARLSGDLTAGTVEEVITDDDFQTPSTAIHYDGHLAVVNAKFDTGFPPTADQYEVVLVDD
jgi:hypothetical protein